MAMQLHKLDHLPPGHREYLFNLTQKLHDILQTSLLGVFLFGSAPSSASFKADSSDLDVAAVIFSPLPRNIYISLISSIRHASIPCPARKLEFVLYSQDAVKPASRYPKFELNFNTGKNMKDHASFEVGDEAGHWFLLDIAMGRDLGMMIFGERATVKEVFSEPKRDWIIDGVVESIRWYRERLQTSDGDGSTTSITETRREVVDAVLNACRGLKWVKTGEWGSKSEGGQWVFRNDENRETEVVQKALDMRKSTTESAVLGLNETKKFLENVLKGLEHDLPTS